MWERLNSANCKRVLAERARVDYVNPTLLFRSLVLPSNEGERQSEFDRARRNSSLLMRASSRNLLSLIKAVSRRRLCALALYFHAEEVAWTCSHQERVRATRFSLFFTPRGLRELAREFAQPASFLSWNRAKISKWISATETLKTILRKFTIAL